MSNVAIQATGLGKQYLLGRTREPYGSLRESLARAASAPLRAVRGRVVKSAAGEGSFWAIRDVSFDVARGEVVGIVGRNGAGKSTLLKVLSRITEPTVGQARVTGRLGSLLEVGTGFHPELTGRDNIFLNGSILGMGRGYMEQRFDEIVAFSGVERFLDTPVKRYSSGMYLRLAFAVAAYMEPDVLIVDEVLAVGDAEFQKKCLGKMDEIARAGRTVLFVSHNLAAVARMCSRAILMQGGRVALDGSPAQVLAAYMGSGAQGEAFDDSRRLHRSDEATVLDGWIERAGVPTANFAFGDALDIVVRARLTVAQRFGLEIVLRDQDHVPLAFFGSGIQQRLEFQAAPGETTIRMTVPNVALAEGRYFLDVGLAETGRRYLDYVESALSFEVEMCDPLGTGIRFYQAGKGAVYFPSRFSVVDGPASAVEA